MHTPSNSDRSRFQARIRLPDSGPRGGAHTLADLRNRCVVDPDDRLGCWQWGGCFTSAADRPQGGRAGLPVVWYPAEKRLTAAARAAWLIAGFPLIEGQVVFRYACNCTSCIHPLHGAAGTRNEQTRHRGGQGAFRVTPHRRVQLTAARAKMMTPLAKVQEAERLIDAGALACDIVRAVGICADTLVDIRAGRHPLSRGRALMAPGASVFNLPAVA